MDSEDLRELINRCVLKDQAALKALYERAGGYLNAVAFNILGSEDLSNEVLQDAFIQIWRHADQYREDRAQPLTWMCSIVRYRALDKLSAERKHRSGRDLDAPLEAFASMSAGPEDVAVSAQQRAQFDECMEALHERGRRCIQLAYLQGYSREELAEALDTNVNTIKSWLRRNVQRLKTCLTQKNLATS